MYKHSATPKPAADSDKIVASTQAKGGVGDQITTSQLQKADSSAVLRDLLEKNLKWSQIIYEQNRKINNKLLWSAVANWLRLLIIIVPIVIAALYLPPFIKRYKDTYFNWIKAAQTGKAPSTNVDDLINLLPLNQSQRDQVKAMMQ